MDNKDNKKKEIRNDLIDLDETKPLRKEENIETDAASSIKTNFDKKHGRNNKPLGGGHEPGTTPGTGF